MLFKGRSSNVPYCIVHKTINHAVEVQKFHTNYRPDGALALPVVVMGKNRNEFDGVFCDDHCGDIGMWRDPLFATRIGL